MQRLRWSQLLCRRQAARCRSSEQSPLQEETPPRAPSEESPLRGRGERYPLVRLVGESRVEGAGAGRREREDPRQTAVLLFPDEDGAVPGMGRRLLDVPAARDLYHHASQILGWDVAEVCASRSAGAVEAMRERREQCVLVTSLASVEAARTARPGSVSAVRAVGAGGVGEYAALVFAGALTLEAALGVLAVRAAALRVVGGGVARAEVACRAGTGVGAEGEVEVCGYLGPGRRAVCGPEGALRAAVERGGGRLLGAGAVYCPKAGGARPAVREALRLVRVERPRVRVVSGTTGEAVRDAAAVRAVLARQVAVPVRWEQVVHALYSRRVPQFPRTLVLAPGARLGEILRRVNAKAWDHSVLESI